MGRAGRASRLSRQMGERGIAEKKKQVIVQNMWTGYGELGKKKEKGPVWGSAQAQEPKHHLGGI